MASTIQQKEQDLISYLPQQVISETLQSEHFSDVHPATVQYAGFF